MAKSTVGVIIPTYNRAKYIGECIDSLLGQSRPVDEIIIVNDGSTDNTLDVLAQYTDPRIKIFTKENGGKPVALNFALARCTSDYVWICDDDDVAAPGGLAALTRVIDADPSVDLAYGRMLSFRDEEEPRVLRDLNFQPRASEPNPKISFLEYMVTNQFAMLVRRALYDKVGPFREDLLRSEDIEMVLRLTRSSKIVAIEDYIFHYRLHEGLRGSTADRFKAADNARKWQKYSEIFYRDIWNSYDLSEFCPTFALTMPSPLAQRAQYLERACVFANQSIWDLALRDLKAAAGIDQTPVSADEIHLLGSVIIHDLPWDFLDHTPQYVAELRQISQMNANGQQIVFALSRRLYRFAAREALKKKRIISGLRMLVLLVRILGFTSAMQRIAKSPLG